MATARLSTAPPVEASSGTRQRPTPAQPSVGSAANRRFVRPLAYQNTPQEFLPPALRDDNPLGIVRLVNGEWTIRAIGSPKR